MRSPTGNSVLTYMASFAVLAAAVGLRWLLDPFLHDALPLVTLFGAVAAAVWLGGYRPGVLVGSAGYVACAIACSSILEASWVWTGPTISSGSSPTCSRFRSSSLSVTR